MGYIASIRFSASFLFVVYTFQSPCVKVSFFPKTFNSMLKVVNNACGINQTCLKIKKQKAFRIFLFVFFFLSPWVHIFFLFFLFETRVRNSQLKKKRNIFILYSKPSLQEAFQKFNMKANTSQTAYFIPLFSFDCFQNCI